MKENEILEEIHQARAEHARECGYDVHKIFQQIRKGTEKLKTEGWRVVTPVSRERAETSGVLREEPGNAYPAGQREKMRELYVRFAGNKKKCVAAYAAAERQGEVSRKRNENDVSPDNYALAMFADGKARGWLP